MKRRTTWDKTNASPEPVKKGKITVQGRLRIANWHECRHDLFTKRRGEVPNQTGSFKRVKTVSTTSGGYVKTTVTAADDGYSRLRYGGNSYPGVATMAADVVDIK